MRVLLTNDDGIEAEGLRVLRRALLEFEEIELAVIAPDGNRSAIGRAITTRRPIGVREVAFEDGGIGFSTDGTPVDCVRLATLGLVEDFRPDLIVAGINHGANLGDDVTYSGTVAAALEGVMLGLPSIAVSLQSGPKGSAFDFTAAASFGARVANEIADVPLAAGILLNINFPVDPTGAVQVTKLGKRTYDDALVLADEDGDRRHYWMYGQTPGHEPQEGTDLEAVAQGSIAITPIHYELTHEDGVQALTTYVLARLGDL